MFSFDCLVQMQIQIFQTGALCGTTSDLESLAWSFKMPAKLLVSANLHYIRCPYGRSMISIITSQLSLHGQMGEMHQAGLFIWQCAALPPKITELCIGDRCFRI